MGAVGRSRWGTLAGLALAAGVACIPFINERAATQTRQQRVGDEAARKAREGAELARQALDLQIESVALMADNAVANPRFLAALRGRVNRGTFADLLATESWWEPYRSALAAISYDGVTLAFAQTEGREGVSVAALVKRAWETGRPASAAMAGPGGGFLVAARPVRIGRDRAAVLALARRIDDVLLEQVARYGGRDVLLSDGARVIGRGGADATLLEPLAGSEWARRRRLAAGGDSRGGHRGRARAVAVGAGARERLRTGGGRRRSLAAKGGVGDIDWARGRRRRRVGAARARRRRDLDGRHERNARRALPPAPPAVIDPNTTRFGNAASGPVTVSPSTATLVRPGPGTALGRYLLVDRIGVGGMAEVYTAVSFGVGSFAGRS